MPKVNQIPICDEFFRRLYIIPKERFHRFLTLIMQNLNQALPHGNSGGSFERTNSAIRVAKIINEIDTVAEPHPSGTGFIMPAAMTKTDLIKNASLDKNIMINATQEIKKLDPTFHFHKANSFTKCHVCTRLKIAKINHRLSAEEREEAKKHLFNHRNNVKNDRRDYYLRKFLSLEEIDFLLSIAHDGMSKHKTKFPHLLNFHTKKLIDALKMMCSLNLAVVHKKSADADHQLHAFWNIDQISGARANGVISQLYFTIRHCLVIPSIIAIQLDNCSANKCYTLFGAFGLLLLWLPKLTKIYVCTAEVGHTHNDVDQTFGVLAKALNKEEVYTPQGYTRFISEKLNGIVTNNLMPTTFDFEGLVRKNVIENGQIYNNHFFELSKMPDNTVVMKIARFQRSETYLPQVSNEPRVFKLFKEIPDLSKFPKIIRPEIFDIEKFNKVCAAVKDSIMPQDYEELLQLPKLIEEQPEPESFKEMLNQMRNKSVYFLP